MSPRFSSEEYLGLVRDNPVPGDRSAFWAVCAFSRNATRELRAVTYAQEFARGFEPYFAEDAIWCYFDFINSADLVMGVRILQATVDGFTTTDKLFRAVLTRNTTYSWEELALRRISLARESVARGDYAVCPYFRESGLR